MKIEVPEPSWNLPISNCSFRDIIYVCFEIFYEVNLLLLFDQGNIYCSFKIIRRFQSCPLNAEMIRPYITSFAC